MHAHSDTLIHIYIHIGTRVVYVVTTNGDKGWGKSLNMTSQRLAGIRYDEQMAAAAVLNVSTVLMLDFEVRACMRACVLCLCNSVRVHVHLAYQYLCVGARTCVVVRAHACVCG